MQLGNIPKLLTLGCLSTLVSAQVAHANPIFQNPTDKYVCSIGQLVDDTFHPISQTVFEIPPSGNVLDISKDCEEKTFRMIQEIETHIQNGGTTGIDPGKIESSLNRITPKKTNPPPPSPVLGI